MDSTEQRLSDSFLEFLRISKRYKKIPLKPGELVLSGHLYSGLRDGKEGLTPTELANGMGVSPSSTSFLLNRMEENGLIERKPGENDRRSVYVSFTEKGKEAYESYLEENKEKCTLIVEKIGEEKANELIESLKMLNRVLREID